LDPTGVEQISEVDKAFLSSPFTLEELKEAVFGMEPNKAAGPDGFNAEFYQRFWDLLKFDLLILLNKFHEKSLNIDNFNHGVVTLVPKGVDADRIQKYRPICLLNVVYKIITKILTNRLIQVVCVVIRASQTAFLKGRYILEGVVTMHETLNEIHREKSSGVLFKIDFEKAFDKVKWSFLLQVLEMKGFPPIWNDWMLKAVRGGRVAIKVNDEVGPYFSTYQGLRQGDPLSPILFDLTADVLAILVKRAVEQGLIAGLASKNSTGVSILQYADDTILLFEDNLEQARNLKFLLCLFEEMSGLKINFHKSEVYCLGRAKDRVRQFEEILTCKSGDLPMKYLGIPIDEKRLSVSRWNPIIEKFGKKTKPLAREEPRYGRESHSH
jgi:hypothetical protein